MPQQLRGFKAHRFPQEKQARMDDLLDRSNRGRISDSEKTELEDLVAEAERLMVENTKRFSQYCRRHTTKQEPRGTPVTVWVREASARR